MCYLKKQGTYDIFGNNSIIWNEVIDKIIYVCNLYNYDYIKTPIFESTELFYDIIGKNTDVISKELYNFYDKNNDNISLRPEGTTGIIRSYLENKLHTYNKTSKFYYYGSMFRHENVDKGRFREFQQFGVEVFNNNSYFCDVEIISLAVKIFKNLGLNDIKVFINNLGSKEDKTRFEKDLKEYFKPHLEELCDDCKKRFLDNPIRILDCKLDKRKDFVLNSIKIEDYISHSSKERFNNILNDLDKLNINYEVNKNLVRGLNYYTDTVFEIKTNIEGYGARNTICGGGRYNNTVKTDDNIIIPAIGFAIGLERLIQILDEKGLLFKKEKLIDYNILFEDIELLNYLRDKGYRSDYNSSDVSNFTIDKKDNDYIFIDNNRNKRVVLSRNNLIKKIVKNHYS